MTNPAWYRAPHSNKGLDTKGRVLHEGPKEKEYVCQTCCNLPWARTKERIGSAAVELDGSGRVICSECKEEYAPEEQPKLDASARKAVDYDLY